MLRLSYIFRHYLLYTRKKKESFSSQREKKKISRRQAISKRLDTKMPNSHKPHFLKPLLPDSH
ncbi:hypothetical protein IGI04_019965 [Brassica rapa subsp. trilocularis]|uniref:Uncharacterized protein n=1 Tax=Brassica rapa subsp. trilocularis TaxID=1813537 RepID=A0ABQ7MKT7_BRACM|nr:hypothetical protein IGI04_019965 [Brassica rapa subsp. trilocularis]